MQVHTTRVLVFERFQHFLQFVKVFFFKKITPSIVSSTLLQAKLEINWLVFYPQNV